MKVPYHTSPMNKFIPIQPQTKETAKLKALYLCTVDNGPPQEEISVR